MFIETYFSMLSLRWFSFCNLANNTKHRFGKRRSELIHFVGAECSLFEIVLGSKVFI